jgi:hypothetical protein
MVKIKKADLPDPPRIVGKEKASKKGKPWTEREVAFLRANYRKLGPGGCAKALGRPYFAVATKAYSLGLTKKRKEKAPLGLLRRLLRRLVRS